MIKAFLRACANFASLAVVLVAGVQPLRAQGGERPIVVPNEIVLKAPGGMPLASVQAIAASAGCDVAGQIAFSPGYYLLRIKGATAGFGAPTRAAAPSATPEARGLKVAAAVETGVQALRATPGVLADPNYVGYPAQVQAPVNPAQVSTVAIPNDPLYVNQRSHMDLIRMPEAWRIQNGVKRVIAAVVDSGFDTAHPDFKNADGSPNFLTPVNTELATQITNDVTDFAGHGTHVSGTVVATTNNATGVVGVAGWKQNGVDVALLPIKASSFDPRNGFFFNNAAVIAAINYAAAQGAGVINLSLGGYFRSNVEAAAYADVIARGIVVVAAAGNDNNAFVDFFGELVYPADYPGVIKVTAVGPGVGGRVTKASYSNFLGNVAIAAPGGDPLINVANNQITSTIPISNDTFGYVGNVPGYGAGSGTSFAAPHVSGVVALLLAAGAPASEIRFALQSTARPLDETPNFAGNNKHGAGLLDAYEALSLYSGAPPAAIIRGGDDRGAQLLKTLDITLDVLRLRNLAAPARLKVLIQTAAVSPTVVRQLVGGRDFQIPTGFNPRASRVAITIPAAAVGALSDNRYQIVAVAEASDGSTYSVDTQFLTIVSREQPVGRVMFAMPFTNLNAPAGSAEIGVFGDRNFQLRRWDPRLASGGDYAEWFSSNFRAGTPGNSVGASFRPTSAGGSLITFDTTNPTQNIEPVGLGYWLDLDGPQTLTLSGNTVGNPVAVNLIGRATNNNGWNMIGDPYTYPVDLSGLTVVETIGGFTRTYTLAQAVTAGVIGGYIYGYVNGDYIVEVAPDGQLLPFNGYWIRALRDCTVIIPSAPSTAQNESRRAQPTSGVAAQSAAGGWRARLVASVAGDRDGQNFFGQAPGAETGEDALDVPKPPSGAGHAYLRFASAGGAKNGGRGASYAFDMRPLTKNVERQEWTAVVSTDRANTPVTLAWEGLGTAPKRARLSLTDTVTGQKIALKSRSSYTYRSGEAGSSRAFTLTLEPERSAGALAITNVVASSGRGVRGVAVSFNTNQDADIVGAIKTLTGKPIARLNGATRSAASGLMTLRWDGRGGDGASVPVGAYQVEITARTAEGGTAVVKQTIQLLR